MVRYTERRAGGRAAAPVSDWTSVTGAATSAPRPADLWGGGLQHHHNHVTGRTRLQPVSITITITTSQGGDLQPVSANIQHHHNHVTGRGPSAVVLSASVITINTSQGAHLQPSPKRQHHHNHVARRRPHVSAKNTAVRRSSISISHIQRLHRKHHKGFFSRRAELKSSFFTCVYKKST